MEKNIVVLEDNQNILELMGFILEEQGYNVTAFSDHQPVEFIADFDPNLILLDVRLGNGHGHLLCKNLKENPETAHIPVILASGAGNLETIAVECRANGFIAKPFDMDELVALVKKFD